MKASEKGDIIFEEDDCEQKKGDTFLSYHRQAGRPLAWLKRCVSPSPPYYNIMPLAIFPVVQLVYR